MSQVAMRSLALAWISLAFMSVLRWVQRAESTPMTPSMPDFFPKGNTFVEQALCPVQDLRRYTRSGLQGRRDPLVDCVLRHQVNVDHRLPRADAVTTVF